MSYELDTAHRYREAAIQLRAIADADPDDINAEVLRRIASEYDRTAENLEALDRTNMRHSHGHPAHT